MQYRKRTIEINSTEELNKWYDENIKYESSSYDGNIMQTGKVILESVVPVCNSADVEESTTIDTAEKYHATASFKYIVSYLESVGE